MSKDGYAGNISKTSKLDNASCIFSDFEYEEKQEAESIGSHTIIDVGWVRNTLSKYALLSWVS